MTITVEATYENGVFKPDRPVAIEPHAKVRLTIETGEDEGKGKRDPWAAAERFIGCIEGADPSEPVAAEHDRYLYK